MADDKDDKKEDKRPKRTTKIVYFRCRMCGRRQRESDVSLSAHITFCDDCLKRSNWGSNGCWELQGRKGVTKRSMK